MFSATDVLIVVFSITNGVRLSHICRRLSGWRATRAARPPCPVQRGSLSVSNLSTAAYGGFVLGERWMMLMFTANAACNLRHPRS